MMHHNPELARQAREARERRARLYAAPRREEVDDDGEGLVEKPSQAREELRIVKEQRDRLKKRLIDLTAGQTGMSLPPVALPNTTMARVYAAADAFGISAEAIVSKSRQKEAVLPRQVAMYVAAKRGQSLPSIGSRIGRHHTTVLYGVRQVEKQIAEDESLAATVRAVDERAQQSVRRPQ